MSAARTLRVASLTVVAGIALAGCTATSAAETPDAEPTGVPAGVVDHPEQEWFETDETTTLGSSDEAIPSEEEIPQQLHVGEIEPIGSDQIVIMAGGGLELSAQAVDPATGDVTTNFTVGPGIWDPVVHAFVGESADDPALLAAEVWRPRGSRGAADFTISTYSGTLLEPDEILMPDYVRVHSRWGSSAVTDDKEYFVFWDDGLYGPRVFDLEEGVETGAMDLLGCGPFTWVNGHDVYSVCEETRELVHLAIQDDGSIEEVERAEVLPDDFVSNRHVTYAMDADKALLVSANGDVFVFDFSEGLPTEPVTPIGNAGQDSGRFASSVINNTATSLAVTYTDSEIHPHSANGGDEVRLIMSDAADLAPIADLDAEALNLTSIGGLAYSVDGATLYVQGPGADEDETLTLIGYDAASGDEVSRVEVPDFVGDAGHMLTPQVLE